MTKIKEIIDFLENMAPKAWQEPYDNTGLLTGVPDNPLTGVLITLDCTEEVVEEAIRTRCNLIIAHHPVIFKPLKSLTGKNYVERTIIKAIKNEISIYAIHTNLDNIKSGVNKKIADKIGLVNTSILSPKKNTLSKLTTFIPPENTQMVLDALYAAGAGNIGNYSNCSFSVSGTGTFKPNEFANPHIGKQHVQEEASENRVEVIFPTYLEDKILWTLKEAHPYEEVAYYLHKLENTYDEIGSGLIGELPETVYLTEFLKVLKTTFGLKYLRYTESRNDKVGRVALCGGSGSFLLNDAIQQKADIFISADFKYHEFFDGEGKIAIVDIGHYESEFFTKELIYETVKKNFTNIALEISEVNTNPVRYL